MPRPTLPDYGQTQNIPIGDYQMPQFGIADVSQTAQQPPDFGDRLSAGFKSWAHTPVGNPFAALANGITGLSSGQRTTDPANPQQVLNSRYEALQPILGDHNAMLAIVHPEVGKTLITRALAGQVTQRRPATTGSLSPPTRVPPATARPVLAMKQGRQRVVNRLA